MSQSLNVRKNFKDLSDAELVGNSESPLKLQGSSMQAKHPAPTDLAAGAGNSVLTIAQLLTGVIHDDPVGANRTWTLPTAELAVAGVSDVKVGDSIDFHVINEADADELVTIIMGANGTAVGYLIVESAAVGGEENTGSALFRLRFTNTTASSETYTCYRLG